MATISCFSVPCSGGTLVAIVPEECVSAHRRLIADDAVWKKSEVRLHWEKWIDTALTHASPSRRKIHFRLV